MPRQPISSPVSAQGQKNGYLAGPAAEKGAVSAAATESERTRDGGGEGTFGETRHAVELEVAHWGKGIG